MYTRDDPARRRCAPAEDDFEIKKNKTFQTVSLDPTASHRSRHRSRRRTVRELIALCIVERSAARALEMDGPLFLRVYGVFDRS